MNSAQTLTTDDVTDLLRETSRTFALAVPLLPSPTRQSVALAYLLFRCADTLEDASTWPTSARKDALDTLARLLDGSSLEAPVDAWLANGVTTHAGYARLLRFLPKVLAEVDRLPRDTAATLRSHARRTTLGMRDLVDASASGLASMKALRDYCYVVAGIVGELLTDLFLQDAPHLAAVKGELLAEQRAFGEGLQLVNILKDEDGDRAEGRSYLPPGVQKGDVFALVEHDLRAARRYVAALQSGGAPPGFVAFTSFPCELAEKTVAALRARGAGAKVSKLEVAAMFARHVGMARGAA